MIGLEGAVHHLIEVVRLVAGAVVGDAVLREVVRADALGAVHAADLRLDGRRMPRHPVPPAAGRAGGPAARACRPRGSAAGTSRSASTPRCRSARA